jgi:predicted ATP-grasp superfamily ATP-dependent carboligase
MSVQEESNSNTDYVISFDLRGSTGVGGDFFVEFSQSYPEEVFPRLKSLLETTYNTSSLD